MNDFSRGVVFVTVLSFVMCSMATFARAEEPDPVMALTERNWFPKLPGKIYGQVAPDFELQEASGRMISLSRDLKGKAVLLYLFIAT
jgi:hypothetical protein